MKGLVRLQEEAHNRVLNYRTIENIILHPKFTRLWDDSDEEEKQAVIDIVENGDRKGLRKWMTNHKSLDLGEKPIVQLRRIGKQLGVKYYAQLSHSELVAAIIKKEEV